MKGPEEFAVLGTAGFAGEVADLVRASREYADVVLKGFVGPRPAIDTGTLWLGTDDDFLAEHSDITVALGLGKPQIRAMIGSWAEDNGLQLIGATTHRSSVVAESCRLAEGAMVSANSAVTGGVVVGRGAYINQVVSIGHDVVVGEYTVVNPSASVSGGAILGNRVLVGANAVILEGIRVGDDAVVGAGAVVTRDVPAGVTVVGIPARVMS